MAEPHTTPNHVLDGTDPRQDFKEMPKEHRSPAQDDASGTSMNGETAEIKTDLEQQLTAQGNAKFNRLGWKRLTVVLIVEAIALGSLSLPSAFATLGMTAGVILSVVRIPASCCFGWILTRAGNRSRRHLH